ncbi:MAG: lysozyme family protein, partial [Oscillospiraceae bacterium]|nr:lysozyme family protein [Oscillospiraceae bacterium]
CISLALQGYNFGTGYISWARAKYGGYSQLSAMEFSEYMAEQMGWESYGDMQYVEHVLRYYPFGNEYKE